MTLGPEMFARVPGDAAVEIGADPVTGHVIFQSTATDPPVELFRVSATDAEEVIRLAARAKYIARTGVGDMGTSII